MSEAKPKIEIDFKKIAVTVAFILVGAAAVLAFSYVLGLRWGREPTSTINTNPVVEPEVQLQNRIDAIRENYIPQELTTEEEERLDALQERYDAIQESVDTSSEEYQEEQKSIQDRLEALQVQ